MPQEKKCNKVKRLSEEALQIAEKRKVNSKAEKEKYSCLNAEFQRIGRKDKKDENKINELKTRKNRHD